MEGGSQNTKSESYTILRIKRKRHEEPLDALVVESGVRRKKSRGGGVGVFRYAQTVEQDAWGNEQQQKNLRDQISRLAQEKKPSPPDGHLSVPSSPAQRRSPKDEPTRRYKIVEQDIPESETKDSLTKSLGTIDASTAPPSSSVAGLKMYSAVLSTEPEVDPEVAKFLPLLNDYLRIHDIKPSGADSPLPQPDIVPSSDLESSDYVWDVFYHRPTNVEDLNEAANVGTLTGLPITDSDEEMSDSEDGDMDDEDSNAEEYYKNDYPEEEDPSSEEGGSSDEFHEHSDYDNDRLYPDDEDISWRSQ